jgi:hypothetical protein
MGVGSGFIWGSAEENDYLYRILKNKKTGVFQPDIWVHHPAKEQVKVDSNRAFSYGGGLAAFRCKHFSTFRTFKSAVLLFMVIIKCLLLAKPIKAANKTGYLAGYLVGILAWKIAIK